MPTYASKKISNDDHCIIIIDFFINPFPEIVHLYLQNQDQELKSISSQLEDLAQRDKD